MARGIRYAGALVAVLLPLGLGGCLQIPGYAPAPVASAVPTGVGESTPTEEAVPLAEPPAPAQTTTTAPSGVVIVQHPIPYGTRRLEEMAAYSLRHYGTSDYRLSPSVIVLHYTGSSTLSSAWSTFASNAVNMGELPGTCSHFLVDRDGTVEQLVPTNVRCRHTIGLNDVAIGIEMVEEGSSGPSAADRAILGRPAQIGAALALVRSLQAEFGIPTENVIGHAMANDFRLFHDKRGWVNDHVDWQPADVAEFRSRL